MKIAIRCGNCRQMWMNGEDELQIEIDFYTKKISCVCPHCKSSNELDYMDWKKRQEHSPLPRIGTMR